MDKPIDILLIEDSAEDAFLMTRELSSHLPKINQLRVETLDELHEALKRPWDVILCDYTLPGFDGLTALRIVRESDSAAPFILVSGRVEEDIAASMMRLGANDYIMKDNLERLAPAVIRELSLARVRTAVKEAEESLKTFSKPASPEVRGKKDENSAVAGAPEKKQPELLNLIETKSKGAGIQNAITERHKAVVNILYVANLIKKHQVKILERHNLTEGQFNVLQILKRQYPKAVSMNLIKEEIINKTSDISRIIDRMFRAGFLNYTHNPKDKRVRNVSITPRGLDALAQMDLSAHEMFLPETHLSEQDAALINEKLKKLLDIMDQ